jgi:hypothetical protein
MDDGTSVSYRKDDGMDRGFRPSGDPETTAEEIELYHIVRLQGMRASCTHLRIRDRFCGGRSRL